MAEPSSPGQLGNYDQAVVDRWLRPTHALLQAWFQPEILGMDRLPLTPFLGVGNHSGGAMIPDTLVWGAAYHQAQRPVPLLILAHDAFFDIYPTPLAAWLSRLGALRARRDQALAALSQGFALQVYPGGDHDACRTFRDRHRIDFRGRTGYVSLAQQARVPIVPIASVGAHEVWWVWRKGQRLARGLGLTRYARLETFPIALCLPWGLWLGPQPGFLPLPARIGIQVLPPMDAHGSVASVDREVQRRLQHAVNDMVETARYGLMARLRCFGRQSQ